MGLGEGLGHGVREGLGSYTVPGSVDRPHLHHKRTAMANQCCREGRMREGGRERSTGVSGEEGRAVLRRCCSVAA